MKVVMVMMGDNDDNEVGDEDMGSQGDGCVGDDAEHYNFDEDEDEANEVIRARVAPVPSIVHIVVPTGHHLMLVASSAFASSSQLKDTELKIDTKCCGRNDDIQTTKELILFRYYLLFTRQLLFLNQRRIIQ